MKRIILAVLFLCVCSSAGWSKLKKDEEEYLDDHFQALKAQIVVLQQQNKALASQLAELAKELADMQKVQGDTHDEVHRDRDFLDTLNSSVRLQQMSQDQTSGTLKEMMALLQSQQQKLTSILSNAASPTPTVVVAPSATPASPTPVAQAGPSASREYYVILVEGDKYTLGVGSGQSVQVGTKLALYKKAAPAVKVGEMQVTDIVDENDCHAQLLTAGLTVEPGDIVHIE